MIQRILNSKNFVACLLAAATGMVLYIKLPFPEGNLFFELVFLWARPVFLGFKYSYIVFLYTTPYIGSRFCSQVSTSSRSRFHNALGQGAACLSRSPRAPDLSIVLVRFTTPASLYQQPSRTGWSYPSADCSRNRYFRSGRHRKNELLHVPFRGADFCLLRWRQRKEDWRSRSGSEGRLLPWIKEILARHGREDDYIEISLDSQYRYNPLHNDLDAYALAYSIASLLNNLFGKGKEPFWQQAYTNLVKFIILLAQGCLRLRDPVRCL